MLVICLLMHFSIVINSILSSVCTFPPFHPPKKYRRSPPKISWKYLVRFSYASEIGILEKISLNSEGRKKFRKLKWKSESKTKNQKAKIRNMKGRPNKKLSAQSLKRNFRSSGILSHFCRLANNIVRRYFWLLVDSLNSGY